MRSSPIGYRSALNWIIDNDDCDWLAEPIISVTACLVADIYNRTNEEVIAELQKAIKKQKDRKRLREFSSQRSITM